MGKNCFSLLNLTLFLIIFDALWGFLYSKTVFAASIMSYVSFILLFILSLTVAIKYSFGRLVSFSLVWLPYLMYTILGYLINGDMNSMTSWINCFILILVSSVTNFHEKIPYWLLYLSGIIALVGIFVQLIFPDIYLTHISTIFQDAERLAMWEDKSGLAGFTYQTGKTASILLYGEVVIIYMRERLNRLLFNSNIISYALIALIIIAVFLTGKRMMSVIAITLPFVVHLFSHKVSPKFVVSFVLVVAVSIGFYNYFISHINELSDSFLFRRFVQTYINFQEGDDITTGRSGLSELAIMAFNDSPIMGIGVGRFIEYTGAENGRR